MNSLSGPGWPPHNKVRQWNVHQVSRNLGKISVRSNSGRKQAEVLPLPALGKGKMFLKCQNRFEPITIDLPHKSQRKIHGLGSNSWSFSLVSFPGGPAGKEPGSQCRRHKRQVQSPGREDPLEKETANCSSILTWKIPWIQEAGGLQSTESQRVGHDWPHTEHTILP